jgi:hypothetical protein
MKVLGIAVRVSNRRSRVSLVLMEGEPGSDETTATVVEQLTVTGDEADWATHIGGIAKAVRGHAASMAPGMVVVRRADQARQTRNSDGPKMRLLIEGGIVASCLDVAPDVRVRNGQECAKACATSKSDLDTRVLGLVGTARAEAAAAALSGLA